MVNIAVANINGLIFEEKAIPLAGFSSTTGTGERTCICNWQPGQYRQVMDNIRP